ncbi:hypothetical protein PMAYCL1PPCAC_05500 [Pristionchus mayeri]|uniref:Uncharacterized protein n=1 Tax=Pristionchus mayeri TaxID=1317129 RepID=A0AAN4ZCQ9_9BILA|nr:hypothetical protein PMAYCL1PPCAC_05500 [Pristionchus mayeri]
MCLLITTMNDLGNEFVEAQPEDIRLYRNIYLNYTADVNPLFSDDFVEATFTFRVDLIGNYSDPEVILLDDLESLELNLAKKVAFSMSKSPTLIKYKADFAVLNRNAAARVIGILLLKLLFWLPIFYLFWRIWWSATNGRLKMEDKTPLIRDQDDLPMETFAQSYQID